MKFFLNLTTISVISTNTWLKLRSFLLALSFRLQLLATTTERYLCSRYTASRVMTSEGHNTVKKCLNNGPNYFDTQLETYNLNIHLLWTCTAFQQNPKLCSLRPPSSWEDRKENVNFASCTVSLTLLRNKFSFVNSKCGRWILLLVTV